MSGVLRKFGPEAARILSAARRYRINPVSAAERYWSLYRHRHFSPNEIHFFRLLDPAGDLARVVSKEELLAVQGRLNPSNFHSLTEDKLRFHLRSREAHLPVPDILALYGVGVTSPTGIATLKDEHDIESFLDALPVSACILKPVGGVHGDGVTRLTRERGGWKNQNDTFVTARDIVAFIEASTYGQWMFQELVIGHPELAAISDTDGLQTIRVVTVADDDGKAEVLAARLRLICGRTARDNFDYGRTGNVIANLDVDDGCIKSVVGAEGEPPAICHVTRHPRTGKALIGYRVPRWPEVQKLAVDAAQAFLPLRTIGWDVAVTPGNPCLIEGNVTWDTLSGEPRMGEIYRYLHSKIPGAGTPGRR